jgi:hypothetical protein
VPVTWLGGTGIAMEGLRTPWGPLGYTLKHDASRLVLTVHRGSTLPPGGLVFPWPLAQPPVCVRLQGRQARFENGEIRISSIPARLVVELGDTCRG